MSSKFMTTFSLTSQSIVTFLIAFSSKLASTTLLFIFSKFSTISSSLLSIDVFSLKTAFTLAIVHFLFFAISFLPSNFSFSEISHFFSATRSPSLWLTIQDLYNRFHKSSISSQCLMNHVTKFIFNTTKYFTMLNLYNRFHSRFVYFFVFEAFKSIRGRSLKKPRIFSLFIASLFISSPFIFSLSPKPFNQSRIISYFHSLVKASIKLISIKKHVNF